MKIALSVQILHFGRGKIIMSNIVEVSTFTLKEGVSEQDFLSVSEKFNCEFMSQQKGFISSTLLKKDGEYLEFDVWATMEDLENAQKAAPNHPTTSEWFNLVETEADVPLYNLVRVVKGNI